MGVELKGKFLLALIFALECFALPTQFYLLVANPEFTFLEALVRFFSFFTVLTNSIVAVCCGNLLFDKKGKGYEFFRKNTTLTAIAVYITIVGLVYNVILRSLENLQGIRAVLTEIFHTVVPILFLLHWLLFVSKKNIPWKSIPSWITYPLMYVIYTLVHGFYTGFYPYPFVDVNKLGYYKAITNGTYILLAFVILSVLLVGAGRIIHRKK